MPPARLPGWWRKTGSSAAASLASRLAARLGVYAAGPREATGWRASGTDGAGRPRALPEGPAPRGACALPPPPHAVTIMTATTATALRATPAARMAGSSYRLGSRTARAAATAPALMAPAARSHGRLGVWVLGAGSDGPEGFCRGQAGGTHGGQEPGSRPDEQRGAQAAGPGFGRDDD